MSILLAIFTIFVSPACEGNMSVYAGSILLGWEDVLARSSFWATKTMPLNPRYNRRCVHQRGCRYAIEFLICSAFWRNPSTLFRNFFKNLYPGNWFDDMLLAFKIQRYVIYRSEIYVYLRMELLRLSGFSRKRSQTLLPLDKMSKQITDDKCKTKMHSILKCHILAFAPFCFSILKRVKYDIAP